MIKVRDSVLKFAVLLSVGLVTESIASRVMNLTFTPDGIGLFTLWIAFASAIITYGYRNRPWINEGPDKPTTSNLSPNLQQDHT